jgi:DNA-binding transcriptional MerR regulator
METYTIGQLASAAGVPVSTVRFYERRGLINPDFRTGGNYRGYTARSIERLRFIRSGQATGFRLEDISDLLKLSSTNQSPCEDVQLLLKKRLHEVREKLAELQHFERVLEKAENNCCKGKRPDLCEQVVSLKKSQTSSATKTRRRP